MKTTVLKIGGSTLDGSGGWLDLVRRQSGSLVIVHGGGPEISGMLKKLGREPRFVDGLRVTDEATMEVVEMVLAGRINKHLVGLLQQAGIRAAGVSGLDGGILQAKPRCERVGEVESVDCRLLWTLLGGGFVPVVSPLGLGPGGLSYNLNGDTAAAAIAGALGAEKLIFSTDVPGLLDGERRLIESLDVDAVETVPVSGGMIPKVEAAVRAVRAGVKQVEIGATRLMGGIHHHAFC